MTDTSFTSTTSSDFLSTTTRSISTEGTKCNQPSRYLARALRDLIDMVKCNGNINICEFNVKKVGDKKIAIFNVSIDGVGADTSFYSSSGSSEDQPIRYVTSDGTSLLSSEPLCSSTPKQHLDNARARILNTSSSISCCQCGCTKGRDISNIGQSSVSSTYNSDIFSATTDTCLKNNNLSEYTSTAPVNASNGKINVYAYIIKTSAIEGTTTCDRYELQVDGKISVGQFCNQFVKNKLPHLPTKLYYINPIHNDKEEDNSKYWTSLSANDHTLIDKLAENFVKCKNKNDHVLKFIMHYIT
uniref:Ras-associating domain-containing protein n=1 Tax=Parastrongyloides trichosuri TaxID=131310 RepID=A0A0N5A1T2_PARTI